MNKLAFGLTHLFILFLIVITNFHPAMAGDNLVDVKPAGQLKIENKPVITPKPPEAKAPVYILVDAESGNIIAEKNSTARRDPASLTKMMTMYVISDLIKQGRISLDDQVLISKKAWQSEGSRMFIKVGDSVPLRDLIKGVIVQSGNDACVALAEYVAGSEDAFADLMNQQAKLLGMKNSHFTDSTGMPHENHYTTAQDMAILARAIIYNFPEEYSWYKDKWFVYNNIRQPNRNRLLWRDPDVDGIKTGHTEEAGYCLAASAKRDGMRLISVVMGAKSDEDRSDDSQSLLTYGFHFYETHPLYAAGKTLEQPRVWLGQNTTIPVGLDKSLVVTIPRGAYKNLQAELIVDKRIHAPINKGQTLGVVRVKLDDKIVVQRPLVALQNNPTGSYWTRFCDTIKLTIYKWLGMDPAS